MTAHLATLPSTSYTIYVESRSVYGNELIYPANQFANQFAELLGKKTFSLTDLKRITALGYRVIEANSKKIAL